jgi:multidrug resistance efflux pump
MSECNHVFTIDETCDRCGFSSVYLLEKAQERSQQLEARIKELEAENKALSSKNALLEVEYTKVWDVLRTYNPLDIELEYIGFTSVGKKTDAAQRVEALEAAAQKLIASIDAHEYAKVPPHSLPGIAHAKRVLAQVLKKKGKNL